MAIHKKLTEEELALLEIIRHPTWLGKFIREYDNDAEWIYSDYQEEMLCDFNSHVSFCCGRAIGKCLHKDCRILNPETGEYLTVEEWYNNTLPKIVSIDDHWKQTVSKPIITPNGIQECLELITVKGFNTKVTLEHPFLTPVGWKEAKDLEVGDFIAIPKALPYFGHHVLPEEDLKILAHFIAEGTYHVGSITTAESEVVSDIFTFANKYKLNIRQENNLNSGKAATYYITKKTGVKNYYLRLLENYGLRNCHSYEKFVPKKIFTLTKNQIAIFLSCLFGDDGWVTDSEIGYATTSERLAKDIHHLLLRFGIIASVGYKNNQYRGCWWLSIKGINNIELFINSINIVGNKKRNLAKRLRDKYKDAFNQNDLLPIPNFHDYKIRIRRGYLDRQGQRKEGFATWPLSYYPTRKKAARIINKDDTFHKFENADIRWVRVKQINEIGQSETYAIEVSPHHTHVVDDIYSHNTVALIDKLVWLCMNKFWDESIVYTVPGRAHLEPVFRRLVNWFRRHPLLRYYTGSRGINSQSFTIKLNNDAVIDCRIAGQSGTGANVVGLHIPVILLDEGGFYPFGTWSELLPCLNTWQEGYQFFVSGVPTGLREKNVLYFADQKDIQFTKHRIPAHRNPRYSEEDEVRNIKQFGGVESEDYIHMVLGEHGAPSYMLFDRSRMRIEDYISFHGSALGSKIKEDPGYLARFYASMPPPKKGVDAFMFGIDLGYTDPTVILGLYKKQNIWRFLFRAVFRQVPYPKQEEIIDYLDSMYNPGVIGIDEGSAGKSVVQHLMTDAQYKHKRYKDKVVPIQFRAMVPIALDADGEEIKVRAKQFGMQLLQSKVNEQVIAFSWKDEAMINELERTTYTKTPAGEFVYKTITARGGLRHGEDHNVAALLCFALAHYLKEEANMYLTTKRVALYRPRWRTT